MPDKIKEQLSMDRIIHTLIVSAVVAVITMYGTVAAMSPQVSRMERTVDKLSDDLRTISLKQAHVIGQADIIHRVMEDRITALEKKR